MIMLLGLISVLVNTVIIFHINLFIYSSVITFVHDFLVRCGFFTVDYFIPACSH